MNRLSFSSIPPHELDCLRKHLQRVDYLVEAIESNAEWLTRRDLHDLVSEAEQIVRHAKNVKRSKA